ncbi:hypothetical protein [Arthrobacter silvisoli]|uniref:hypothetical protein n=1 Tax=Arthrobacter silvisoli TaxID=2291022 RepID=UPI00109BED6A|nr:hypothetical protein [Arthrobacter silvisoli]
MAVWGRAIAVVALLAALAACEYTEEGEPPPSARPGSPSTVQPDVLLSGAAPDPETLKRAQRDLDRVSSSLGKVSPATVTKSVGGIAPSGIDPASQYGGMAASSRVDAGKYLFRTTCLGDQEAFLIVVHEGDPVAPRTIRCGEIDETDYKLAQGPVTIRLRGKTPGTGSAGGVHVLKVPGKP